MEKACECGVEAYYKRHNQIGLVELTEGRHEYVHHDNITSEQQQYLILKWQWIQSILYLRMPQLFATGPSRDRQRSVLLRWVMLLSLVIMLSPQACKLFVYDCSNRSQRWSRPVRIHSQPRRTRNESAPMMGITQKSLGEKGHRGLSHRRLSRGTKGQSNTDIIRGQIKYCLF